jgi:hypothetical protein
VGSPKLRGHGKLKGRDSWLSPTRVSQRQGTSSARIVPLNIVKNDTTTIAWHISMPLMFNRFFQMFSIFPYTFKNYRLFSGQSDKDCMGQLVGHSLMSHLLATNEAKASAFVSYRSRLRMDRAVWKLRVFE